MLKYAPLASSAAKGLNYTVSASRPDLTTR